MKSQHKPNFDTACTVLLFFLVDCSLLCDCMVIMLMQVVNVVLVGVYLLCQSVYLLCQSQFCSYIERIDGRIAEILASA